MWISLARTFVKQKICVVLGLKDAFHLNGIPRLNGMLGVAIRRDRPRPQPEMLLEYQLTTTPLRTTSLVDTERLWALPLLLLWQVYLDNLDDLEVWDCDDAAPLRPEELLSQQQAARETYDFHGIPRSEKKEEFRSSSTKALGHRIEGTLARIGPPQLFVARLIHFNMISLAGGPVSPKCWKYWRGVGSGSSSTTALYPTFSMPSGAALLRCADRTTFYDYSE